MNHLEDDVHVAKGDLAIAEGIPIFVGIDFGLTPACVFAQRIRTRWVVIDELVAEDMGIVKFSELMKQSMAKYFQDNFIYLAILQEIIEYKQMKAHHFKY